jgi:hypothetical protein
MDLEHRLLPHLIPMDLHLHAIISKQPTTKSYTQTHTRHWLLLQATSLMSKRLEDPDDLEQPCLHPNS